MGRPIKKVHIGERGAGTVGGEGILTITLTDGGTGYTAGALVISAPDLVGGVQAEGTFTETAGVIDGTTITVEGSGYTSPPTVDGDAGGNGDATLAAVLTTTGAAVIAASAYVTSSNLSADIKSQKGSKTYRVTTSEGTLDCTLVAATPAAAGEMAIIATDSAGDTYWVTKLTNNSVVLKQDTGTEFADGTKVKWADVAVLNESVKITS
jgi:hypothetical protein